MKITVIGAGSSYTPEILEGLVQMRDCLPVEHVTLVDIDQRRLEIMGGFCRRFLQHLGSAISIETSTDRRSALKDASFVLTQIRVGGNAQRVLDEQIPLKYGIIGQETTGPGGMFKALRTIPVMLEIARDVEQVCPNAWIVNYANPTGMVTEAVTRFTHARIAGLCSGGLFPRNAVSQALKVPPASVDCDYYGLNHLNFAWNLRINGRPLTDEEFDRVAEVATWGSVKPVVMKSLRLIASPYLQHFFHRQHKVEEARRKTRTRGQEVQELEQAIFAAYADPAVHTKPEALARRGGGGYSEVALGIMDAIHNNSARKMIVNVPAAGAIPNLPHNAVVETQCLVNAAGITPLVLEHVPQSVWGLVAAVKNYEQLTVEAAVSGSRDTALAALLAHPLCGDWEIATALLDEMLQANRRFLPRFFA